MRGLRRFRRTFTIKIHYLTSDFGVKVTQNVAQYLLHYVSFAPVKFEVAKFNG